MVRTRVGYAGGTRPHPTYQSIGDHTETLEVDYDPRLLRYEDLLAEFWAAHDPTREAYSRQYRSVILVRDEAQRRVAEASLAAEQARRGRAIKTAIEPWREFTRAEDYHQKYYLRGWAAVAAELLRTYPDGRAFADSTAAARLNGYLGGHGGLDRLEQDLPGLGISPQAAQVVRGRLGGRR